MHSEHSRWHHDHTVIDISHFVFRQLFIDVRTVIRMKTIRKVRSVGALGMCIQTHLNVEIKNYNVLAA